jgi:hypothetical protein
VEADELAAAVAQFLSNNVDGDVDMFAEAGMHPEPHTRTRKPSGIPPRTPHPTPKSPVAISGC